MKPLNSFKKIYILGDNYVGKSTLVRQLLARTAENEVTVAHPDDMTSIYRIMHCSALQYEIIDIGGNELYYTYRSAEIANSADLIVMVYEASNPLSLTLCQKLIRLVGESLSSYVPIVFVGNKLDLVDKPACPISTGLRDLVSQKHHNYEILGNVYVSSTNGRNLDSLHGMMMKALGFKAREGCCPACS